MALDDGSCGFYLLKLAYSPARLALAEDACQPWKMGLYWFRVWEDSL